MKTLIILLTFVAFSFTTLAQTNRVTSSNVIKDEAKNALYHANDTVGVKDRYQGFRVYIITGFGYHRNGSKQIFYDCKDLSGNDWYFLPEVGIKKFYKFN